MWTTPAWNRGATTSLARAEMTQLAHPRALSTRTPLPVVRHAAGEEFAEVTPSPSTPCPQPTDIGPATGGRATQPARRLGRSRTRSGATPGTVGAPHPELTFARFT
jgi:hypothetical protein